MYEADYRKYTTLGVTFIQVALRETSNGKEERRKRNSKKVDRNAKQDREIKMGLRRGH